MMVITLCDIFTIIDRPERGGCGGQSDVWSIQHGCGYTERGNLAKTERGTLANIEAMGVVGVIWGMGDQHPKNIYIYSDDCRVRIQGVGCRNQGLGVGVILHIMTMLFVCLHMCDAGEYDDNPREYADPQSRTHRCGLH